MLNAHYYRVYAISWIAPPYSGNCINDAVVLCGGLSLYVAKGAALFGLLWVALKLLPECRRDTTVAK